VGFTSENTIQTKGTAKENEKSSEKTKGGCLKGETVQKKKKGNNLRRGVLRQALATRKGRRGGGELRNGESFQVLEEMSKRSYLDDVNQQGEKPRHWGPKKGGRKRRAWGRKQKNGGNNRRGHQDKRTEGDGQIQKLA